MTEALTRRIDPEVVEQKRKAMEAAIPPLFADARLELLDAPVHSAVRDWCDRVLAGERGTSLLLLGPTGTGKTFAAYAAVRYMFDHGLVAVPAMTTAEDLFASLQPQPGVNTEEVYRAYATAKLLLVDDLGASRDTAFAANVTSRLIDHRYRNLLPGIYTTNAQPRDLATALPERVVSRLRETCEVVPVVGEDRRKARR
ncbi:ATP-binding protein [Amycolatopsis thermophila]|uniref:DNA replication protein DnaC n=1 Tax=Amycolatopsis thermophila TaxID=206084 RepID=A0ABU0ENN2_9PSEU|nr:ATP-binding protein [Amycolatopsis thermophila]MDQ0376611.1 DNA replication protein DnaC [Amycolatopsis thermophila]